MNTVEILIEKLQYARDLQKKTNFQLALQNFLEVMEAFETEGKHEGYVMDCLSGICQSLANLGRVNEIPDYIEQYKTYRRAAGWTWGLWGGHTTVERIESGSMKTFAKGVAVNPT